MNSHPKDLDSALNEEAQLRIREVVRALPEESLSLAWRSQLNERLIKVRPEPRWRLRVTSSWKPVLAMTLAGCLALTVGLRTMIQPRSEHTGIEASLVNAHDDTSRISDLVGAGLGAHEMGDTTQSTDSSTDWTETDLNAL